MMANTFRMRGVKGPAAADRHAHNRAQPPLLAAHTLCRRRCDGGEAGVVIVSFEYEALLRRMIYGATGADAQGPRAGAARPGHKTEKARGCGAALSTAMNGEAAGPDTLWRCGGAFCV